jgi:hypothetical protein
MLILSDQAFPAILPANVGKCIVIVWVEDGHLSEIENAFCDLFAEFLNPNGGLPRGSLISLISGQGSWTAMLEISSALFYRWEVEPIPPLRWFPSFRFRFLGLGGGGVESKRSSTSTSGFRALGWDQV